MAGSWRALESARLFDERVFAEGPAVLEQPERITRGIAMAEAELHRSLEDRYSKPLGEILTDDLNPMALAQMKSPSSIGIQ